MRASQPVGTTDIGPILALLHSRLGFDFREYRQGTLVRRIEQRIRAARCDGVAAYAARLETDPAELDVLFRSLLIPVTGFFRDPEAWTSLRREVVRELVRRRPRETPIRAWVVGCSTGEEAYSLAMLLIEEWNAAATACPLQIFASDVNAAALAVARLGSYPAKIATSLSRRQLRRFFLPVESRLRVTPELRRTIVFARHDVLRDPPYAHLDLISCRNLLIYLQPAAQNRVVDSFRGALAPGGYLFLGTAEDMRALQRQRFDVVSDKWRIYRRRDATTAERTLGVRPRGAIAPSIDRGDPAPSGLSVERRLASASAEVQSLREELAAVYADRHAAATERG